MSDRIAALGPCAVPVVPIGDFSKKRLTRDELMQLWKICGPSASINIERNPLWIALTMAYFEGLMHGAGLEAERHTIQKIRGESCYAG